ncbi:MAG TPA: protein phosphatase 2C domain-containing protein [Gemmataceae bacterium]|nr:protein phosphatase 2C domain-containing protein [Gemmataceae bacterium]
MTLLISDRAGVTRFRGHDEGTLGEVIPVVVIRQRLPEEPAIPPTIASDVSLGSDFEFTLPDIPADQATIQIAAPTGSHGWPGVAWEQALLLRAAHLSLPRLIDSFSEDGYSYLVEEIPTGVALWDAWDRSDVTNRDRFGWLTQIAAALDRLHFAGAIVEGLRPEMIVVSPSGLAILADLTELLPLPLPADVPLRGGFSTAPELLLNPAEVDARSDLFAFGALLYALLMGRELSDLDFTLTGTPKHFLERVPDANPFIVRILSRTFVRDPAERFPTADGALVDRTGFHELMAALGSCRRNLDRVKIDVAAWSTVGMVRSGNEDGVTIYHTGNARLDDTDEAALVLLADGMGGMASGEVAAALALHALRQELLASPPFSIGLPVTPLPAPPLDASEDEPTPTIDEGTTYEIQSAAPLSIPAFTVDPESPERSSDAHAERVTVALREANTRVFAASQNNQGARGMGCTAEVVLVDGASAVVGHVGDSRVYRMRGGKLVQITRDHTLVGRLVELGQITPAEAEVHPRRSELHQAIGGRPDVYPDVYAVALEPGDWIIVCSDGLSNQVTLDAMQGVLRDARNAERAARRLVNLALFEGALDNVTVAVVRVA